MSKMDVLQLADEVFDTVMGNPEDPNNRIICGRRSNSADGFDASAMIDLGKKNAVKRVRHAQEALSSYAGHGIDPSKK